MGRIKSEIKKVYENQTLWALTFTKKLVIVIVAFFIMATIYTGVVMVKFYSLEHLGTVYSEICNLVQTVAFGYLIKAGIENVPKIIIGMKDKSVKSDEEVNG